MEKCVLLSSERVSSTCTTPLDEGKGRGGEGGQRKPHTHTHMHAGITNAFFLFKWTSTRNHRVDIELRSSDDEDALEARVTAPNPASKGKCMLIKLVGKSCTCSSSTVHCPLPLPFLTVHCSCHSQSPRRRAGQTNCIAPPPLCCLHCQSLPPFLLPCA